jgi:hypothetical protein
MLGVRAKSSSELVHEGLAFPVIQGWAQESTRKIEFLPVGLGHGDDAIEALQISARSPLGAVAFSTGGILVDDGWLRVLGAGSARLARTIAGWNGLPCDPGDAYLPGAMFVADDVLGGMFAVDVGALGAAARGNVCYFDPRSLTWHDTQLGYGDWLRTMMVGTFAHYDEARWPGWEADTRSLPGTHAFALEPKPWVAGAPLAERGRHAITMRELRDGLLAFTR